AVVVVDGADLPAAVLQDQALQEVVDVLGVELQIDPRAAVELPLALEVADAAAEQDDAGDRQLRAARPGGLGEDGGRGSQHEEGAGKGKWWVMNGVLSERMKGCEAGNVAAWKPRLAPEAGTRGFPNRLLDESRPAKVQQPAGVVVIDLLEHVGRQA